MSFFSHSLILLLFSHFSFHTRFQSTRPLLLLLNFLHPYHINPVSLAGTLIYRYPRNALSYSYGLP
jgi:hypothetical protein